MKRKTGKKNNADASDEMDHLDLKDFTKVDDMRLPAPHEVAMMLKNARVTLILDQPVIDFFKEQAKKNGVKYQRMIREVLRTYASRIKRAA